jgi:hypothetical protein
MIRFADGDMRVDYYVDSGNTFYHIQIPQHMFDINYTVTPSLFDSKHRLQMRVILFKLGVWE